MQELSFILLANPAELALRRLETGQNWEFYFIGHLKVSGGGRHLQAVSGRGKK